MRQKPSLPFEKTIELGFLIIITLLSFPEEAKAQVACAKLFCEAVNTALPCVCGAAMADAANPWCCAGNNSVYANQAACQVGACAPPPPVEVTKRIAAGSIEQIMSNILEWALSVAGYFFLLIIIIGGALYISSTGEENKITAAKKTINWAIIGAILILVAYTISSIVYKFFGF